MNDPVDLIVVGSGLCGLTIAATAARNGLRVCCVGDGQPGASLANFGQLHSGAVFAPVLPDVAEACWNHRDRWHDLATQARIGSPYGYGLFSSRDTVDAYQRAWQKAGIAVAEIDPADAELSLAHPIPAAAFRLPDFSVDLVHLYQRTMELAVDSGMRLLAERHVTLHRDPSVGAVSLGGINTEADMIVLATGAGTPALLDEAGISHTLYNRRVPWGELTGYAPSHLTYWLDGDLLAVSPTGDGARVGQPGTRGGYGTDEAETRRLRIALDHHQIAHTREHLDLRWGLTCEPTAAQADPTSFVADLRHPPQGWDGADNLMVALPGKWVTAWHCADRVAEALA